MVGDARGPPGAVVGVAISPEGLEPGVLWVGGIPVVRIVAGIPIVVPVGGTVVDGIVVGMGVTPLPVCVVHPAHRIAAPTMQIRRMELDLFMNVFYLILVLEDCCVGEFYQGLLWLKQREQE